LEAINSIWYSRGYEDFAINKYPMLFKNLFEWSDLFKNFRLMFGITAGEFSNMLGINCSIYRNIEQKRKKIKLLYIKALLEFFIKMKNNDVRRLLFHSRTRKYFSSFEMLTLRIIRKRLKISTKSIAKDLNCMNQYVSVIERGTSTPKKETISKYREILRKRAKSSGLSWNMLEKDVGKEIKNEKRIWERARQYEKIINIRDRKGPGASFEQRVFKILTGKMNFDDVFTNVILSTPFLDYQREADIFAVKAIGSINGKKLVYDTIVECKSRNSPPKDFMLHAQELKSAKDALGVCSAILITDAKVSDYIKAKINKSGIIFFDRTDLIRIGYDKRNLGRNIQAAQP